VVRLNSNESERPELVLDRRVNVMNGDSQAPKKSGSAPSATVQLYSVKIARQRLGLGLTKFYELINEGEISTVKIGGRRLVSEAAINEFVARHERRSA